MIKATKWNGWRFYLMHYESMKKEQILVAIARYKSKLQRNLDVYKSTKHNKS